MNILLFSPEAMTTCTIGRLPIWNPRGFHSEGCESLTSSTFQPSKLASGAWKRDYTRASFASCLHRSSPPLKKIGKLLRSSCSASQECLWGFQTALLFSEENQLKDRASTASRSSRRFHFLDLDKRGLNFYGTGSKKGLKTHWNGSRIIRSSTVDAGNENEYCDRPTDNPQGACSFRRSKSPSKKESTNHVELPEGSDPDQSGYTIKVSKELMGVFRYVEKVKRARIKELANTLRQTAGACMFFSCVRGIVGPLVEVFQTNPPSWGRLILMLSAFDSFAITYLALKASEPLEKLSMLASESEKDIMGSIEKEEEHMLALAVELVKLFRRLRNIVVCTAIAQFASVIHSILRLNNPKLIADATKIVAAWLNTPWN